MASYPEPPHENGRDFMDPASASSHNLPERESEFNGSSSLGNLRTASSSNSDMHHGIIGPLFDSLHLQNPTPSSRLRNAASDLSGSEPCHDLHNMGIGSYSSLSSFANVTFGVQSENRAEERRKLLLTQASNNTQSANPLAILGKRNDILNSNDSRIKEDILRMIIQYLNDEGFQASKMTLQDESNVRLHEQVEYHQELRRLRKAILDGDWAEVDKIISASRSASQPTFSSNISTIITRSPSSLFAADSVKSKAFMYALYKQQYLEYIEHHEMQKAFSFLSKRLKPLEQYQSTSDEFRDLCYLLTAKSVHDAASFRNWDGVGPGRERLAERLYTMVAESDFLGLDNGSLRSSEVYVPPNRLITLLKQAVGFQIEYARFHPKVAPRIHTLLEDYSTFVLPNVQRHVMVGHRGNVKCADFVGHLGRFIASGSSDNTVRLWDTESGAPLIELHGHTSRIWDLTSNRDGSILATASGDGTVRLWDLKRLNESDIDSIVSASRDQDLDMMGQRTTNSPLSISSKVPCSGMLEGHNGDVYAVQYHPANRHICTGGYDKTLRLFDVETCQAIKALQGHQLSISKCATSPMGNLIVTGSKDSTIKFWDIVSGLCIRTITSHLGEVTSVELSPGGNYLLSSSKDNSNRLWDMRMLRPLRKFKGHTNTAKNFVRASFAGSGILSGGETGVLVAGGSEDGVGYIWDCDSGALLQKLRGHTGVVYDLRWSAKQSLFLSCSDDATIRTWTFDEKFPLSADPE